MRITVCVLLLCLCCGAFAAGLWHHPLYLDGGGTWRQRIALDGRNDTARPFAGEQATNRIGGAPGRAGLPGQRGEGGGELDGALGGVVVRRDA